MCPELTDSDCRAADQGMVLADMHVTPGSPWEYCPRSTLRRVLGLLDKEFGLVSILFQEGGGNLITVCFLKGLH